MHTAPAGRHAGNVGRAPGREARRLNGERHYINHRPHFSVHYYPNRDPEELWFNEWEHDIIAYGYHLEAIYHELKANSRHILEESSGPYDPNSGEPYIHKIEHRMRL
jgi:hypothetical protein